MKKRKSTGFALLLSFCSMLLCIVALLGTSFAWFTSTDTVAVNQIRAGTLGIELVDSTGERLASGLDFYKKDASGNITTENVVWEPGATYRTKSLYIKNVGDLDVIYKYIISIPQLSVAVAAEGTETDAETNQSATLFESIDFAIVVCDSQVTGENSNPEVCRFKWTKGNYSMEISADTLSGENVEWNGEKPEPLPDIFSLPAQKVASMQNQGINSRYYIYMEGTMQPDASASVMGAVLSGIQITAYAYQSNGNEESGDTGNVVTITSSASGNDAYVGTLTENNVTYKFVGSFESITITTDPGLNQIFDGSEAAVSGKIKFTANKIADGVSDLTADRSGNYTIKNFVGGSMSIGSCAVESLTISGCTTGAIDLNVSNTSVALKGNKITRAGAEAAVRYDGSANDFTMYVYADNYDLIMTDNIISDGHTANNLIYITGNYEQFQKDQNVTWANSISMTGNELTSTYGSALKFVNDVTYAPVSWPADYEITEALKTFAAQYFTNTISVPTDKAKLEILCRAAGKDDTIVTELDNDVLNAIAIVDGEQ